MCRLEWTEIGRLVRGDGETNFGEIVSGIVRGG